MDLLGIAGRHSLLPIILCCSSRDELDAVCSAVSNLPFISFSPLVILAFFHCHVFSNGAANYYLGNAYFEISIGFD